jgi:hypothetical protein
MEPNKAVDNRRPDGTFGPGNMANPNGRPKGKTLKEFAREWYLNMSDEDKIAYIKKVEEKRPGFAWEMGEGKARQDIDLDASITGPSAIKLTE